MKDIPDRATIELFCGRRRRECPDLCLQVIHLSASTSKFPGQSRTTPSLLQTHRLPAVGADQLVPVDSIFIVIAFHEVGVVTRGG